MSGKRRLPGLDGLYPALAGDEGGEGEADEQAALYRAGDAPYPIFERRRVCYAALEKAIRRVVASVGDERAVRVAGLGGLALQAQRRLAAELGQVREGRLPAERLDLDRQRPPAQGVHHLRLVG